MFMKKIFLLFMGLVLFSDYAFAYEENCCIYNRLLLNIL